MLEINNEKELTRQLTPLTKLLGYSTEMRITFGPATVRLTDAYKVMKGHLTTLAKTTGAKVKVNNRELSQVISALRLLNSVFIERTVTRFFRDLSTEYLRLTSNWNTNTCRSGDVTRLVRYSNSMLNMEMTLSDTIATSRTLLAKLRNEVRFRPPAYDLARHYLDSITLELKKKETVKDA